MRRFDRRTLIRAIAVIAGLVAYYSIDWLPLQRAWQSAFAFGLDAIGHDVRVVGHESVPYLLVEGQTFLLSPNCTYVDFALVLTPLLWRPNRSWRWNLGLLLAIGFFLALFNWTRVLFAIHVHITSSLSWRTLHFWPDFILHVGLISGAAICALWTDWRESLADLPGSVDRAVSSPDFPDSAVGARETHVPAGRGQV
jgi:hypothetical protein